MMGGAILLVNTGTPDNPGKAGVKEYLTWFLNDPLIMDMPSVIRKILVNNIIIPLRVSHSSSLYKKLWTPEGSPLRYMLERVVLKVSNITGDNYKVIGAMRYGNPNIADALNSIRNTVNKLTVVPLYPQYSSSTTGSVKQFVADIIATWTNKPELTFIDQFYSDKGFISSFASVIARYNPEEFDHIIFSYHSLPVKHLRKSHTGVSPEKCKCEMALPDYGAFCYKATCYETTRLLSTALKLRPGSFSTSFQSRMFGKWAGPFTDALLLELLEKGNKKILVAAPSFTIDCLETIVEIGHNYGELLNKAGGKLVMAESLNDNDDWIRALTEIILKHST